MTKYAIRLNGGDWYTHHGLSCIQTVDGDSLPYRAFDTIAGARLVIDQLSCEYGGKFRHYANGAKVYRIEMKEVA